PAKQIDQSAELAARPLVAGGRYGCSGLPRSLRFSTGHVANGLALLRRWFLVGRAEARRVGERFAGLFSRRLRRVGYRLSTVWLVRREHRPAGVGDGEPAAATVDRQRDRQPVLDERARDLRVFGRVDDPFRVGGRAGEQLTLRFGDLDHDGVSLVLLAA